MNRVQHIASSLLPSLLLWALLWAPPARADFRTGEAAYLQGDFEAAMRELAPLAQSGEAMAQYYVGLMYARGQGAPRDQGHAYRWLACAAERVEDPEVRLSARRWRDQVGGSLTGEARERIGRNTAAECVRKLETHQETGLVLNTKRKNMVETVVFFAGDATVLGAFTVLNGIGFSKFAAGMWQAVQYMGDWLVGGLSLVWWLLGLRVFLIFLGREPVNRDAVVSREKIQNWILPGPGGGQQGGGGSSG